MTRFETIRTLRKHVRLSERRSELWKQNKIAKGLIYFSAALTILYLIFFAVMISLIANSSDTETPYEIIFGFLPFMMGVDFGSRFMAQQTPSQLIKPYILLPIPKYTCIDSFIISSLTNWGNMIWMGLFLPYTIMSVLFSMGLTKALVFLFALYLIILIFSQWYMLVRSFINRSYLWWILPAVVFALIFSPWYIGKNANFSTLCETYAKIGIWLEHYPLAVLAVIAAILAALIAANRKLQYRFVYDELAKVNQTHIKHVSEIKSLDRFGEVGEYIKLEIKSIMRNKNCRKSFITGMVFVLMFSLLISFTNIYDAPGMKMFLVLYNFSIFGTMLLSRVMCFEGNYIDCLMTHKENILSLFKAKYYFYSSLLILPLLLMIPIVVMGKGSILMLLAFLLLTGGPIYCLLFVLVIFNKQTMPLNTKFIGKGSMETNYVQLLITIAVYVVPLVMVSILRVLLQENVTFIVLGLLGICFILTHNQWLRWVYGLFMKRRYENMEGLRATR